KVNIKKAAQIKILAYTYSYLG
ncbi:MAG: hypothetical protein RIQ56_783, partial [Candidatus Parcubacteria bacterium]